MAKILKPGTYKVTIEFTLEEEVLESEMDEKFENALYDKFGNVSSGDIGEYKKIE